MLFYTVGVMSSDFTDLINVDVDNIGFARPKWQLSNQSKKNVVDKLLVFL